MIDRNCQWRVVFLWSAHHEILYHVHHGTTRFSQLHLGFSCSTGATPDLLPKADQLGSERSPLGVRGTIRGLVWNLFITRRILSRRSMGMLNGDTLVAS